MHVTPPTAVDALVGAPDIENIQEDEENTATQDHISNVDADLATEEVPAIGGILAAEVAEVEHVESEVEIIPATEVGSDILIIEGTFAQDPNDDAPLEDMADVHDSYDVVLADGQDRDT
jgi:uridine kinase